MKIPFLFLFFICRIFSPGNISAQSLIISGNVKDRTSGSIIPYVNIRFPGTNTGTVSDSVGNFKLTIPEKLKDDSVIFLAVGYKPRNISVHELSKLKSASITLDKKIYEVKEVEVQSAKGKLNYLGFQKGKPTTYSGQSYAMISSFFKPENSNKPYYIKSVKFYGIGWKGNPQLRIRIQKKDSIYFIPGEDIVNENIIVSPIINDGWVEFDLSRYNILVEDEEGIFVTFEKLANAVNRVDKGDGIIYISGFCYGIKKMKEKPLYSIFRQTNFSKWQEQTRWSFMIGATILQ